MSAWLAFVFLVSAHAARPKLFALLNDRLSVHETRARLSAPRSDDFGFVTADWPLDPARSRELEAALEHEFDRRLLTYSNNHLRAGTLPYVIVRIDLDQTDIERHWVPRRSKSRRTITTRVSFVHTLTDLETAPIEFEFTVTRKHADDPAPKLRLVRIGPYVAERSPAKNSEILSLVLDDVVRVCQADLYAP